MKTLQDYIQDKQTKLFEKTNTFFAFSDKQLKEGMKEGLKYVNMGAGMICEKGKEIELSEGLSKIHQEGREQDIKENGIDAIIKRELYNHEIGYTMDITQTVEALELYPINEEQIEKIFRSLDLSDC